MQGLNDPNRELLDASTLCRQLVPKGSVEMFLADHRHELFPDEMFEDLFPSKRGRPSIPADTVASVMVLQALESRRAWRDGGFISDYQKHRPMVERSIAWLVRDHYRRVRFRGVAKNQLGLSTRVAAINLRRLINLGLAYDGRWVVRTT